MAARAHLSQSGCPPPPCGRNHFTKSSLLHPYPATRPIILGQYILEPRRPSNKHMAWQRRFREAQRANWNITRPRGASWRPWRLESGQGGSVPNFKAGYGWQGGQHAAQDAARSAEASRTRSYAHCGLRDMGTINEGKRNIF